MSIFNNAVNNKLKYFSAVYIFGDDVETVKSQVQIDMARYNPQNIFEALAMAKKTINKRYQGIVEDDLKIKADGISFNNYGGKIVFSSLDGSSRNSGYVRELIKKAAEASPRFLNNVILDINGVSVKYDDGMIKVEPLSSNCEDLSFGEKFEYKTRKLVKDKNLSETLKKEAERRGLKTHIRKEVYGEKEVQYGGVEWLIRKVRKKPTKEMLPKTVEMLCIVPKEISRDEKIALIQKEIENKPKYIRMGDTAGIFDTFYIRISPYSLSDLSISVYGDKNKSSELLNFATNGKTDSILKEKWNVEFEIDAKIPDITEKKAETPAWTETKPKSKSEGEIIAEELVKKGYYPDGEIKKKAIAEYCVLVRK